MSQWSDAMKQAERINKEARERADAGREPTGETMSLLTATLEAATAHLPAAVTIAGVDFTRTGKLGTHRKTGQAAAEYADAGDRRCWVRADGVAGEVE